MLEWGEARGQDRFGADISAHAESSRHVPAALDCVRHRRTFYRSSFRMTPAPEASKMVAPVAPDRLTVNVSSPSRARSPLTTTVTDLVVSPGLNTSVPEVAV